MREALREAERIDASELLSRWRWKEGQILWAKGLTSAAIDAYQRGALVPERYRGRAGQPRAVQEAEYARLLEGGTLGFSEPLREGRRPT